MKRIMQIRLKAFLHFIAEAILYNDETNMSSTT